MPLLRSSLLAVGFLAAFLATAFGDAPPPKVYLSFEGGSGSPLRIIISQPISYTIDLTGGSTPFFNFIGTNCVFPFNSVVGGTTATWSLNDGAPQAVTNSRADYTGGVLVAGDIYFFGALITTHAVGDTYTINPGVVITGINVAAARPSDGFYVSIMSNGFGVKNSSYGTQTLTATTLTQGQWDYAPKGSLTGTIEDRAVTIDSSTNKIRIGSSSRYYDFTSPVAVRNFLPSSGTPRVLSSSLTDPARNKNTDNTFAAQLLSLTLNMRANTGFFHGLIDQDHLSLSAAQMSYLAANNILLVKDLLDRGNSVIGGTVTPSKGEPGMLTSLLDLVNKSFPGGVGSGVVE
jgi:hypothetical protein